MIREGAALIQSAEDVIEALGPIDQRMVRSPGASYDPEPVADASDRDRDIIRDLLGPVPVGVDEIIRQSGLAPPRCKPCCANWNWAARWSAMPADG